MKCSRCKTVVVEGRFKTCDSCRAYNRQWSKKFRPCTYCGGALGERQSVQCGAEECVEKYDRDRQARLHARWRERYATDPAYREWRLAASAAWRDAGDNRERLRERDRARYAEQYALDPTRWMEAWRRRKALKVGSMVVPFTADQLKARLAMYAGCWICGDPEWHEIDHVKPLSRGGPHMLSNLRPACKKCNRQKSATWPFPVTRKVSL